MAWSIGDLLWFIEETVTLNKATLKDTDKNDDEAIDVLKQDIITSINQDNTENYHDNCYCLQAFVKDFLNQKVDMGFLRSLVGDIKSRIDVEESLMQGKLPNNHCN